MSVSMGRVRALLFDVFGTCVDWRGSVIREARRLGLPDALADLWRALYQPQMETVRSGAREWTTLDVLHREALDRVLAGLGCAVGDPDELNLIWHRLDPWPDTVEGLTRLKRDFVIAPCSNGNIALLVDMAKHAGLPWDAILGAEVTRAYKPQPEAYLRCVSALGLQPAGVTMVAAHNADLAAAAACGLHTAFVPRPTEDTEPTGDWDHVAADFLALADALTPPGPGPRTSPRTQPGSGRRRP
jgi:2-haloacid dehalogenase